MSARIDLTTNCHYLAGGFAATYALGALDGDEARGFARHLPACRACQEKVAAVGASARQLPLTAPELTPPGELRERLLAAARDHRHALAQSGLPTTVASDSDRPADDAVTGPRPAPPARRSAAGAYALAAVLLLGLSLGLLGWNLLLQREAREAVLARERAQAELVAVRDELGQARAGLATWNLVPAGGHTGAGSLLYLPRQQQAIVVVNGLPPLPPGHVYQIWLIQNGTPRGAGLLPVPTGEIALRVDLTKYQLVTITVEPGPDGSPAPTTPPLLTGAVGQ